MKWVKVFLVVLILAGVLAIGWPEQRQVSARAPEVFSSPLNGGCYIAAPNQCRFHVDPFTVNLAPGQTLEAIQLRANGQTIYDFRTDVSNPPGGGAYTPSLVALDFAATCGETYILNVVGQDSGDTNFLNMGQTTQFTCPSAVP